MFRSVFKDTVFLYFGNIVSKLLYFALIVFISRYLGAVKLGQYASSFAFVSMFFLFVNVGLDNFTIREIAAHKETIKDYLLSLVLLRIFFSLMIFFAVILISGGIEAFEDIRKFILILAISLLVGSMAQIFYCILIAHKKIRYVVLYLTVRNLVTIGLAVLGIVLGRGILYVVFCFLVGSTLGLGFGAFLVYRMGIRPSLEPDITRIRIFFKKSLIFSLSALLVGVLFRIDMIMLKLMEGNYAVGIYRAAYSFLMNLEVFAGSFMLVLYPEISRLYKSNPSSLAALYERSFRYALGINAVILIGIFMFGKTLMAIFFGRNFTESAVILQYSILPVFFLLQNTVNYYFFNSIDRPELNALVFGMGALMNFLLNLYFIPRYGYYGVLPAIFISYIVVFIVSTFAVSSRLRPSKIHQNVPA